MPPIIQSSAKGNRLPRYLLLIPVIVAAVLLAYGKAPAIPLISDDYRATSDLSGWWGGASSYFFRPLSKLFFDLLRPLCGQAPAAYHWINMILHAANALLVFLVGMILWNLGQWEGSGSRHRNAGPWLSASLALAFAFSYSHSEAVFWIVGITSLLEGFFILLVTYFYLRYLSGRRFLFLLLALFSFLIGLGAKEGCLLVVGIVPILYLIHEKRLRPTRIAFSIIPFWAMGLVYWLAYRHLLSGIKDPVYAFRFGFTLFRNIQQFFLSVLYWTPFNDTSIVSMQQSLGGASLPHTASIDAWLILALFGIAVFIFMMVTGGIRTHMGFLLLLGVTLPFSLPPLPLCGWFRYPYPFRTYYLPVVFFAFLLVLYLGAVSSRISRRWMTAISVILLAAGLFNAVRVWHRTDDWIVVGRKYGFTLEKLKNRIQDMRTPLLQVRVVDPESDGPRSYNRGIFTLYYNGYHPLLRQLGLLRRDVVEERFLLSGPATILSPDETQKIREGLLTVILYDQRMARKLRPDPPTPE